MRKQLSGALFAGLIGAAIAPVQAGILDGWQLDSTGSPGGVLTTNIGELSLTGGFASVTQQVNGSGTPYAGARFSEYGTIFSVNYIAENIPGPNDFGFPQDFAGGVDYRFTFTGLNGFVSNYNAGTGGIEYIFDSLGTGGGITFDMTTNSGVSWANLATLDSPSGGGDLNDFWGTSGTNGNSSLDSLVATMLAGLFKDSAGNPLDYLIPLDGLIMSVRTNNEISSLPGPVFACDIDGDGQVNEECVSLLVTSNGSANLAVPEPTLVSLLGLGLLASGFAGLRRRRGLRA